jgi:hypothetical protein
MNNKSTFTGKITSIQPRIRLTRSFDEASHTYLGYAIKIAGTIDGEETTFSIGIGKAAQAKFNSKLMTLSPVNAFLFRIRTWSRWIIIKYRS